MGHCPWFRTGQGLRQKSWRSTAVWLTCTLACAELLYSPGLSIRLGIVPSQVSWALPRQSRQFPTGHSEGSLWLRFPLSGGLRLCQVDNKNWGFSSVPLFSFPPPISPLYSPRQFCFHFHVILYIYDLYKIHINLVSTNEVDMARDLDK